MPCGSIQTSAQPQTFESLSRSGKQVLCVVAKGLNVIRYLTYPVGKSVEVAEFYNRPFIPDEIVSALSMADIVLVENDPRFDDWFRSRLRLLRESSDQLPFGECELSS